MPGTEVKPLVLITGATGYIGRRLTHHLLAGDRYKLVDLPGTYSLDATTLDQEIARDYLLSHEADLFVNVVDASNLERHLYLTVQLLEMGVPLVVALNMIDVADKHGIHIDPVELGRRLGCPVVPVVASRSEGGR